MLVRNDKEILADSASKPFDEHFTMFQNAKNGRFTRNLKDRFRWLIGANHASQLTRRCNLVSR